MFLEAGAAGGKTTELSVGYGGLPAMRFIPLYYNRWENINPWGAVTIALEHQFGNRWFFGFHYTISSASSASVSEGRKGAIFWHSMMAVGRYQWYERGRLSLYSALGAGTLSTFMDCDWADNYGRTVMAFQATPIGLTYILLDNVDLFSEAGYGVEGILKLGFRVDF